jgi:hypothetical protein
MGGYAIINKREKNEKDYMENCIKKNHRVASGGI